jgi:hypothetical protein
MNIETWFLDKVLYFSFMLAVWQGIQFNMEPTRRISVSNPYKSGVRNDLRLSDIFDA